MSGYTELRNLGVTFMPPNTPLPSDDGISSPFSAKWGDTVTLLATELRNLNAERIVVELAIEPRHFRVDGSPRSDARLTADAVRIAFQSDYGPLMYETGRFTGGWGEIGWQANIRAIALGLESLRRVDRYGITKRGEQYKGWAQLPASTDPADAIQTLDQARAVLDRYGGLTAAVKATHPDTGGDPIEFRKVMRARELVGA